MSEEGATKEKKWTEWSVVNMNDGSFRCRRTNVEDGKDAEYRTVPRPVFTPAEITAMIEFGAADLIPAGELAAQCYKNRYRALAFRMCGELNTLANGAK